MRPRTPARGRCGWRAGWRSCCTATRRCGWWPSPTPSRRPRRVEAGAALIGLAVALGLAARSAPQASDLTIRMQESAAAAQALQGPLDGTWALSDAQSQPLFMFQIADPAGGAGQLQGAWRRSGGSAPAAGLIDTIA